MSLIKSGKSIRVLVTHLWPFCTLDDDGDWVEMDRDAAAVPEETDLLVDDPDGDGRINIVEARRE